MTIQLNYGVLNKSKKGQWDSCSFLIYVVCFATAVTEKLKAIFSFFCNGLMAPSGK